MKVGTWIHDYDGMPLDEQIAHAAGSGLQSLRSYHVDYAQKMVPTLKQTGLSLFADVWTNGEALARDWRSQLHVEELARYHDFGVPLEVICVGNELRQDGNDPNTKQFTARLSFGLANLIEAFRQWMDERGYRTPLTYAMEGIVFDDAGNFHEWVWPLVDACDVVSVNLYPMDNSSWFGFGPFDASRRFLQDARVHHDRFVLFEVRLRRILQQLESVDKPLIISETGFPSAIGYHKEGDRVIVPDSHDTRYGELMQEFVSLIQRVNADYGGRIQALYFYEWRDNLWFVVPRRVPL